MNRESFSPDMRPPAGGDDDRPCLGGLFPLPEVHVEHLWGAARGDPRSVVGAEFRNSVTLMRLSGA